MTRRSPQHRPPLPIAGKWFAIAGLLFANLVSASDALDVRALDSKRASTLAKQVVNAIHVDGLPMFAYDGNYDRGEMEARAALSRAYFAEHNDDIDFLLAFTDFEFEKGEASAFANRVKNDTLGVGLDVFDSSAAFGSASGRLQVYIDMADLDRWEWRPGEPRYAEVLDTSIHELMHRWVAHPRVMVGGQPGNDLLGRDQAHWNFFLDSDASLMYGARWVQRADGSFEATEIRRRLSDLDLYLGGLLAASEVAPIRLIRGGQGASATDLPRLGFTTAGQVEQFTINDVIAASGVRVPNVSTAKKHFKAGLILILRPSQPIPIDAAGRLGRYARDLEIRFQAMTRGRATLSISNALRRDVASAAPLPLTGSAPCGSCAFDPALSAQWLTQTQRADGSWRDKAGTVPQATAAVLRGMALGQNAVARDAASQFLSGHQSRQFDDLRWKLAAQVTPGVQDSALEQSRRVLDADARAGLDAWFAPSAWDLASAIEAAQGADTIDESLPVLLARLSAMQNADGSFAVATGGRGHLATTAYVASRLASIEDTSADATRAAAAAWLLPQLQPNGQLGGDEQGIATAWTVTAFPTHVDAIQPAISFLRSRQGQDGDYSGSALTTAEVLRAVAQETRANLRFDFSGVSILPTQPIAGDNVRLGVRVINDGPGPSVPSVLNWFDGDPDVGGAAIGGASALPRMAAGQVIVLERNWPTIGLQGAHTLHVDIDPLHTVEETSETDNRVTRVVDLGTVANAPDAAFDEASFGIDPADIVSYPTTLQLSGRVRNLGGAALVDAPIAVYAVQSGQRIERARQVVSVAPQSDAEASFNVTVQREDAGYLLLVADPDNTIPEIREANNELRFELSRSDGLDLEVLDSDLVQITAPAMFERDVDVRVSVRNRGSQDSGTFALRARVDFSDTSFTASDIPIQLAAGNETSRVVRFPAQRLGAATFNVQLVVSGVPADINPANNSASLAIEIVDANQPNLTVNANSLLTVPAVLDQGAVAELRGVIRNTGAAFTTPVRVEAAIGSSIGASRVLGSVTLPDGIAAGVDAPVLIPLATLTESGVQSLFLRVDADNVVDESSETDNIAFKQVTVRSLPDLAVSAASIRLTPTNPVAGELQRADLNIRNLGGQPVEQVTLHLLAGDVQSGQPVGLPVTIARIEANASAEVSIEWTFGSPVASSQLTLVVDPDLQIIESREDNNIAVRQLSAAAPSYASEPYFSPDGDAVKDTTEFHFTTLGSEVERIDVVDRGEQVVRSFARTQFASGAGVSVVWDGRRDDGRIAHDGVYRALALAADGTELAQATVTLDNDRSAFVEAVGTQYEMRNATPGIEIAVPAEHLSRRADLVIRNPRDPEDPNGAQQLDGVYRFDPVLSTLDLLIDDAWQLANGEVDVANLSVIAADGRWFVFGTYVSSGQMQLWRTSMQARSVPVLLGTISHEAPVTLHDAGRNLVLLWSGGVDGTAASATLIDLGSGAQSTLQTPGVQGSLLQVSDQWLVVGVPYFNRADGQTRVQLHANDYFSELHVISRDPGVAARTVFASSEEGYVAVRSDAGALVHQIVGGRERLEWRAFASSATVLAADRDAANVCHINWMPDAGRSHVAAMDHAARVLHVIDLATGASRQFPAPARKRHGAYAQEHETGVSPFDYPEGTFYEPALLTIASIAPWGDRLCLVRNFESPPVQPLEPRHLWISPDHVIAGVTEQVITNEVFTIGALRIGGVTDFMQVDLADGTVKALDEVSGTNALTWPLTDPADIAAYSGADVGEYAQSLDWRFATGNFFKNSYWSYPVGILFEDGSGVGVDQLMHADAHVELGRDPEPVSYGDEHWAGAQRFIDSDSIDDSHAMRMSLLNGIAALRVRARSGGLLLSGIAMDRNLASWQVEWMRPELGPQWHPIGGEVSEPANGELMFWAPPEPGDYRLRLTVRDHAGNEASDEARAIVREGADIDDVTLTPTHVSPNGDGVQDNVDIAFDVLRPTELAFEVHDGSGNLVYQSASTHAAAERVSMSWDGRNNGGIRVADGTYRLSLGPWFSRQVIVDTIPPTVSLVRDQNVRGADGTSFQSELYQRRDDVRRPVLFNADDSHFGEWRLVQLPVAGDPVTVNSDHVKAQEKKFEQNAESEDALVLTATDLAGNVASATLPAPTPELRSTASDIISASIPISARAWGCDGTPSECVYDGEGKFVGGGTLNGYSSGKFVLLDLWVPAWVQSHTPRVMQRADGGEWQTATLIDAQPTLQGWRLTIDPMLGSAAQPFTLQAFVATTDVGELRSEFLQAAHTRGVITEPKVIERGQPSNCAEATLIAAAGPLGATQSLVCANESFDGIDPVPQLRVHRPDGSVQIGQLVLVRDGTWLFRIEGECSGLDLAAHDRFGESYEKSGTCTVVPRGILDVAPDVQSCGSAAAERVFVNAGAVIAPGRKLVNFTVDALLANGEVRSIAVNNYPATDAACVSTKFCLRDGLFRGPFATAGIANGNHAIRVTSEFDDSERRELTAPLVIDRGGPQLTLNRPEPAGRACLSAEDRGEVVLLQNDFDFRIDAPTGMGYRYGLRRTTSAPDVYAAAGNRWRGLFEENGGPFSGTDMFGEFIEVDRLTEREFANEAGEQPAVLKLREGESPYMPGTTLAAAFNGPLILDVEAIGWSGAPVCRSIEFVGDSGVNAELLSSHTHVEFGDGHQGHSINPVGPEIFRSLDVQLRFDEALSVQVYLRREGVADELLDQFDAGSDSAPEIRDWSWNGQMPNGTPAASGTAHVAFDIVDACGHLLSLRTSDIEIDSVPPDVTVVAPLTAGAISAALVPLHYLVADDNDGVLLVEALIEGGVVIASDTFRKDSNRLYRHSWNRSERSGPVILRFTATDAVGNQSVTERQIELSPRPVVLIAEASLAPDVFSPNGDGRFDSVTLNYSLAQATSVSVRLLDDAANVLSTLVNNEPKPPGGFQLLWNGSGLPTPAVDGSYALELSATSAIDSNVSETLRLAVEVDVSAPLFSVVTPAGNYSTGAGPLVVDVVESNFAAAQWQLGSDSEALDRSGRHDLLLQDALAESAHTLSMSGEDAIGNHSTYTTSFTIDRTMPIVRIDAPLDTAVLGGAATQIDVLGAATDLNFEHAAIEIRNSGGGAWATIATLTQPIENSTLASLGLQRDEGRYELRLSVTDHAGNVGEALQTFDIDRTPPTLSVQSPVDGAMVGDRLVLTGSVQDAHLRDYRLRIATQALADLGLFTDIAVATETVASGTLFDLPFDLPDADYVIEVIATDAVDLKRTWRARITRDVEAPATPLQLVATREGAADVLLAWTAVTSADLAGYAIYRDGARINDALVTGTQSFDRDVSDGRIGYRVTAVDHAGNESAPSNRAEVVIDRQPPLVRLDAPQAGAVVRGSVDVIGSAHSETDFERYRLYLEGPLPATTRSLIAGSTQPVQSGVLGQWDSRSAAEGSRFRLVLEATDNNGNQAETSVEVEVDNLPPGAPSGLTAVAQGSNAELNWDANAEPDLFGYVLLRDGNPVNSLAGFPDDLRDIALTLTTYLDQDLADGDHEWQVHAIDRAGNLSAASQSATLSFSNRAPEIRIVAPVNGYEFTSVLTIVADSDDTDIVEVRFSQRAGTTGSWSPIGTPVTQLPYRVEWDANALAYGDYQIRVEALDAQALEDPTPAQIEVRKVDRTAPAQVQDLQAQANAADVVLNWSAVSDTDLDAYQVQRRACAECADWPVIATVVAGTHSYTDSDRADGRAEYRVLAVDQHGNAGAASASDDAVVFTLQVEAPNSPTLAATVDLKVTTPRAGELSGTHTSFAGTNAIAPVNIAADAAHTLVGLALEDNNNRFDLSVLDAQANRSRVAIANVARAGVPSVPTGLAVGAIDHEVTATWNANPESNVVGYRLWHRGQAVLPESALTIQAAVDALSGDAADAIDGDPATGWLHHSTFASASAVSGRTLTLTLPAPRLISGLTLTWMQGRVPARYRIEAHSGSAFVPVREVALPATVVHAVQLDVPYYSAQFRIVLEEAAAPGPSVSLAEIQVRELPLIDATTYALTVLDGRHEFQVSAVNDYGFESARSAEVGIDVGDAIAPDPVVLTGFAVGQEARLSWTASSSADTARYQLLRDGIHLAYVDAAVLTYVDAPRPNGSDVYVVIAEDAVGNASVASNAVVLDFAQSSPGIPLNLSVTVVPEGSALQISWEAGVGGSPDRYQLRRAEAESGPWLIVATTTQVERLDAGLSNGVRYWYTVEALDAAGNGSGESAPVSGVPSGGVAPNAPLMQTPVRAGEAIEIHRPRVLVTGTAQPGSTVQVRSNGQTVGSANALATAQTQLYSSVPVSTSMHASPAAAWLWSGGAAATIHGLPEAIFGPATNATHIDLPAEAKAVGWTRDELLVSQRANAPQLTLHTLPSMATLGAIDLPFESVSDIAIGSDLRKAIIAGRIENVGEGNWVFDVIDGNYVPLNSFGVGSIDFTTIDIADNLDLAVVRTIGGAIWLIDLNSGNGQQIVDTSAATDIDIDAGSGRVLWGAQDGAATTIRATDLGGDSVNIGAGVAAAWIEDGASIAIVQLDGTVVVRDAITLLETRRFASGIEAPKHLHAAESGRLLVANALGDVASIDAAGSWRVPELAMSVGRNTLTAIARDASGHTSNPSLGGDVIRLVTGAPDLAVSGAELRVLPASGPTGAIYAALATVRNIGDEASLATTLEWALTSPSGDRNSLSPVASVPALTPGSSVVLSRSLGVLNEAGAYRVAVEVDSANAVAEHDELNNFAATSLLLGNNVMPVLELVPDASSFAPGVDVTAVARLINPGATFSGALQLQVLDGANTLVAEIGTLPVQNLAFGQALELPVRWIAAGAGGGSYRMRAVLRDGAQQQIAMRTADFEIRVVRDLLLTIQAEQPVYSTTGTMDLHSTLQVRAANAALQGAVLNMMIIAPNGQTAFAQTLGLPVLMTGYRIRIPSAWPISGVAGVYELHADLTLAGVTLASGRSSVVVVDPLIPNPITGAIEPAPVLPAAGRAASIGFAASTTAGTPTTLTSLRLRLFDAAAVNLLGISDTSGVLSSGAAVTGVLDLAPLNLDVGNYLAVLDVLVENETAPRALATRSINIVDGLAPDVVWQEPIENGWVRRPSELAARVVDLHSAVERVEIAVDGAGFRDVAERGDGLFGTAIASLPDGAHVASARALDRAGNLSTPVSRNFIVDGTPPLISISGVSDGDAGTVSVTPVISVVEAHPAGQLILLDGQLFNSGDTVNSEGDHLLAVSASDLAGNESRVAVRFRIDQTAPVLTFAQPIDGDETVDAQIDVVVSSEPGARIELTVGAFNSNAITDAAGLARFNGVSLAIGSNTLSAIAIDAVGNRSAAVSIGVTRIDNSGSVFAGSLVPAAAQIPAGNTIAIDWQVLHEAQNARSGVPVQVRVEHVASQAVLGVDDFTVNVPAHGSATGRSEFASGSAELGVYVATLLVDDGGQSLQLAIANFELVDADPPIVTVLQPLPDALLSAALVVRARVVDTHGSIGTPTVRVDGGTPQVMTIDGATTDEFVSAAIDLADGAHSLVVDALDNAGNAAQSAPIAFVVDRTPPEILVSGVVNGERRNTPASAVVEVLDVHPATTTILLDGQVYVSGTTISSDGLHQLVVEATDAGGLHSSREIAFEIDRTAPVIAFTFPSAGAVLATNTTDIGALTEAGAQVEFELAAYSATVFADAQGTVVVPQVLLAVGSNTLRMRATDDLGNVSAWVERTLVHEPNAGASLLAKLKANGSIGLGAPLDVKLEIANAGANAVAGVALELRFIRLADQQQLQTHALAVDLAPGALRIDTHQFDSSSTLPGAHVVTLAAMLPNAVGTNAWQMLATVAVDVQGVLAPNVTITAPPINAIVDSGFMVHVDAIGRHGVVDSVQVQAGTGPWLDMTLTEVEGRYVATLGADQEGLLRLQVRAQDAAGNVGTTSPRDVLVDLHAPVIAIGDVDEGATYGHAVQPVISISDVALASSTNTLDGVAFTAGASIATEGAHVLVVHATDALERSSEVTRRFVIDTTAPVTRIDAPVDGATISAASTSVLGVVNEPNALVTLNVGAYSSTMAANGAGVFQFDNVPLVTGANTIRAFATDQAPNVGTAAIVNVARVGTTLNDVHGMIELRDTPVASGVDLALPVRLTNAGVDALVAMPVTLEVRDEGLGQTLAQLQVQLDIASGATVTHNFTLPTGAWGLGTRALRLSATLPSGGSARLLDTHLLELEDREAPELEVLQPLADAQLSSGALAQIRSRDRLSALARVELRIDGSPWSPVAADGSAADLYSIALPALPLGPHELDARSVDAAGNYSEIASVSFRMVGELPLTVDTPLDGANVSTATIQFVGRSAAGSEVTLTLGAQTWRAIVGGDGMFVINDVPVPSGEQVFSVRAADSFGNRSALLTIRLFGQVGAAPPEPIPMHPLSYLLIWFVLMIIAMRILRRRQGVSA